MPYSLATLPDAVKELPSRELQRAWMEAYNSAHAQYDGDEAKAAATAWAVIKKMGYEKKNDRWIKMESYKKDLLIAGEYPHPQDKTKIIKMDLNRLKKITDNTIKFLQAGGSIPITVSHPKSEKEKIDLTQGWLEEVWLDEGSNRIFGNLTITGESDKWIKDGKLKAVSPGVYHDVVTSKGIFPMIIDHVALTSSPHNLGQFGFLPMNAESFSKAELFFENHCVSYQAGGDDSGKSKTLPGSNKGGIEMDIKKFIDMELANLQKELYAIGALGGAVGTKVISPGISQPGIDIGDVVGPDVNGGTPAASGLPTDMAGKGLEELQKVLAVLNASYARIKAAVTNAFLGTKPGETGYVAPPAAPGGGGLIPKALSAIGSTLGISGQKSSAGAGLEANAINQLIFERDTAQNRIKILEAVINKGIVDEKKSIRTNFEARLEEDITMGLIKPANRNAIVAEYETLVGLEKINFEGKEISIEDYILSRYEEGKESKLQTTLKIDLNHFQFENKQYDINTDEGREALYQLKLKRAKELAKGIEGKTHVDFFEQAHKEIDEELFGAKE